MSSPTNPQDFLYVSLLDSPPEEAFDRWTRLASRLLDAPVSLVSIVDSDRQFFKSMTGLSEPWASRRQTPLTHSFCRHVVGRNAALAVGDARKDPLVSDNPAVPELGVIAYLGVPLSPLGEGPIGAMCVIDDKPRDWTREQIELLENISEAIANEMRARHERDERRRAEERLQAILDNLYTFVFLLDSTGALVWANKSPLTGANARLEEMAGKPFADTFWWSLSAESRVAVADAIQAAAAGAPERMDVDVQIAEGRSARFDFLFAPVETSGRITHIIASGVDISERAQAEARREMLASELAHRGRNILSVVQAIVRQSLRSERDSAENSRALEDRLQTLARTHMTLLDAGGLDAPLRQIVESEMNIYGDNALLRGPDIRISSRASQSLSLLLHELATNAAKYGALSVPNGQASVEWQLSDGRFRFTWRESGGPRVAPPARKGFGTVLIERLVGGDMGAEPILEFRPDGVTCVLETDASSIGARPATG